jgi:hypothetical protein
MTIRRSLFAGTAAVALLAGSPPAAEGRTRADCLREYAPQRAQEGKDVMWAPTEDAMVTRMLEMANVTASDKVYDLGAGDGKIPIAAGKHFGATAVGIEYDAALVKHAQCLAEAEGVQDLVEIVQGDIFEADFSDATVVTLYLLPALNLRLRPTLLGMRPGTRVVSYSFTMREWQPDEFIDTDEGSAYLWIVPAEVGGSWSFRPENGGDGFDLELTQTFQRLRGTVGDARLAGKLAGERIEFSYVEGGAMTTFAGAANGDRIRGTFTRAGRSMDYVGTRLERRGEVQ